MVHPIVSVGWRFLLASIAVLGFAGFGRRLALTPKEHAYNPRTVSILLELRIISPASLTLTTGLISVVFPLWFSGTRLSSLVSETTIGLSGSSWWWDWCLRFDHFVPYRAS